MGATSSFPRPQPCQFCSKDQCVSEMENCTTQDLSHGTHLESACCLAWNVSSPSSSIGVEKINALHQQLGTCLKFFKAEVLEDSATSGLILGPRHEGAEKEMTSEDALTRMGQLLCRWATSQAPTLSIHIGVDIGNLVMVELPNSQQLSCFGTASEGARRLAEASLKEGTVHISSSVRRQLSALRFLPMIIGSGSTFYLEAFTEVLDHEETGDEDSPRRRSKDQPKIAMTSSSDEALAGEKMSYENFCELLRSHSVDLSRFGKGTARTLRQFYNAAVIEEKCFLKVEDGRLQRMVELVRINLHFRSDDGQQRELRILSEVTADGGIRARNQPLAVVLRNVEHGNWQKAVERCFTTKFGLSPVVQRSCFATANDAYSYQENSASSESIPGILTKYKTHSIKMTVKDRTRSELERIGLPEGKSFITAGEGRETWTWARVSNNKEEELICLLQKYGVSLDEFTWQSFVELHDEVYEKRLSQLEPSKNGDELVRYARIVKIWLWSSILGCRHTLVLRTKQQHSRTHVMNSPRVLSMRMSPDQTWEEAVVEALSGRLGISEALQREGLHVMEAAFRQEVEFSRSFPGLKTLYKISEVHVELLNPQDQRWNNIGLPAGVDFTFVRQESSKGGETDTVVTRWGWTNAHELESELFAVKKQSTLPSWKDKLRKAKTKKWQVVEKRQVEIPEPLEYTGTNEVVIAHIMQGKVTDWARARHAAEQIRSPSYTTREFHADITAAFPELRLYCLLEEDSDVTKSQSQASAASASLTTSGRSAFDEYQRTIGALFCVFWLMRQHLDGRECFCFGLNSEWQPRSEKDFRTADGCQTDELQAEWQKRQDFYKQTDWDALEDLVVGAGLLKKRGGPHDPERTLALLVLMVIHDLMKLDRLRPVCAAKSFMGYKKGELIGDHDIALSYVMERHASALPSFAGLGAGQQRSILFTHRKLEYNMGWLVQAEAPPGALFRAFRRVIADSVSGNASNKKDSAKEVAFYFIHWFADLAGAEPFPLQGCEKFVLKFPKHVLTSFVESFPVVWNLGPKTETQVYEDYLEWRWQNLSGLGPVPLDSAAIAKMRLVVMSQSDGREILRALSLLDRDDTEILSEELALTGLADQSFTKVLGLKRGPAFLLYYAPAMMQKAGVKDPVNTLRILAELLRKARELWPLSEKRDMADSTVIIRIDVLKDTPPHELIENHISARRRYILCKNGETDGQVKAFMPGDSGSAGSQEPQCTVLDLDWNSQDRVDRRNSTYIAKSRTSVPMFASTFSSKTRGDT